MSSYDTAYLVGYITGYALIGVLIPYLFFLIYLYLGKGRSKYKLLKRFSFDFQSEEIVRMDAIQPGIIRESASSGRCESLIFNASSMRSIEQTETGNKETELPLFKVFRVVQLQEKTAVYLVMASLFGAWSLLQLALFQFGGMTVIFSIAFFFFLMYRESEKRIIRIETLDLNIRQYYYRKSFLKKVPGGEEAIQAAIAYINRSIQDSKQQPV